MSSLIGSNQSWSRYMKSDYLILVILFFFIGCTEEKKPSADVAVIPVQQLNQWRNDSLIKNAASLLRNGDLVLRTGTDFSSEEVKGLSPVDKTYSHAGIAFIDSSGIFIYHIEPDPLHVHDKVRKEALDSFCNPAKNTGFAIARYQLLRDETGKFISYLHRQYEQRIPFDLGFHLETNDSMYCSEMISKGLAKVTAGRIRIPTSLFNDKSKFKIIKQYLRLPEKSIANREFIPIDHLFLNRHCTEIRRYLFHTN